jgi:putative peptidoglycan lipid II flippase
VEGAAERSIAAVASATGASRILGLLRDMLLFALLGLSPWNGIFVFAFTVPNLFRRLLGEGALASAMLPLFSETLVRETPERAFTFLNQILTRLAVTITLLLLFAAGLFFSVCHFLDPRWEVALRFTVLLSPYLPLTCLCAMLCGALNGLGSFGWPALTSIWLNCSLLLAGAAGLFLCPNDAAAATRLLCGGVLAGGCLQLAFPWLLLRRHFWTFRWTWSSSPLLLRLWRLFLPALLGAAVVQVNATISRLLAFSLTRNGISTLYLASRLVELPLGIFSISVATVAFPELSRLAAAGDRTAFTERYRSACRSIAMVTIPAMLGLCLLGRPILTLLFRWGHYGASELDQTLPVLCASALGIPSYALSAIAVRAFHARQDMATPLRIALVSVATNLFLTATLARYYDATGIALAGVLSSLLQWALLEWRARRFLRPFALPLFRINLGKLLLANGLLVLLLLAVGRWVPSGISPRPAALLQLSLSLPLGFACYFFALRWVRFAEVSLFSSFLLHFFRRRVR